MMMELVPQNHTIKLHFLVTHKKYGEIMDAYDTNQKPETELVMPREYAARNRFGFGRKRTYSVTDVRQLREVPSEIGIYPKALELTLENGRRVKTDAVVTYKNDKDKERLLYQLFDELFMMSEGMRL